MGPHLPTVPPRPHLPTHYQADNMQTLTLLLSVFLASVSCDADADAYYSEGYFGTVFQGPYAYQAPTPTRTIVEPKSNHIHSHAVFPAVPAASYDASPLYPAYTTAPVAAHYTAPVATHTAAYAAPVATQAAYTAPITTHTAAYTAPVATHTAPVVPSYVSHNNYGSADTVAVAAPEYESSVPSVTSSQFHSQDEAGNFAFGYNNANGAREESGNVDTGVMGSYTGADGQVVRYVADNYGFRLV